MEKLEKRMARIQKHVTSFLIALHPVRLWQRHKYYPLEPGHALRQFLRYVPRRLLRRHRYRLSRDEFKLTLFICNTTLRYNLFRNCVSRTEVMQGGWVSQKHIVPALNHLIKKGIVVPGKDTLPNETDESSQYRIASKFIEQSRSEKIIDRIAKALTCRWRTLVLVRHHLSIRYGEQYKQWPYIYGATSLYLNGGFRFNVF